MNALIRRLRFDDGEQNCGDEECELHAQHVFAVPACCLAARP
jgi:hypothetical protein